MTLTRPLTAAPPPSLFLAELDKRAASEAYIVFVSTGACILQITDPPVVTNKREDAITYSGVQNK